MLRTACILKCIAIYFHASEFTECAQNKNEDIAELCDNHRVYSIVAILGKLPENERT